MPRSWEIFEIFQIENARKRHRVHITYIAKNSVINQDKRGEDSLQEECPKHTNSPDTNFPSRPSTMTETKEPFSPRGPVNAYSSYSTYDPEIIMLKSKFERLTEQVATRLDELAFEINVVN